MDAQPAADRERVLRYSVHFEGCKQSAEFHRHRPRRFVLLSTRAVSDAKPRTALPPGAKTLLLVRHGEGVHNVWRAAEFAAGRKPHAKRGNRHDVPATLHDPLLTVDGEAEVAATAEARAQQADRSAPTLVVTSPLRRAVQTMLAVFGAELRADASRGRRCVAVAHELAREQFSGPDPSLYDSRLPRDALVKQFPQVDFESFVLPVERVKAPPSPVQLCSEVAAQKLPETDDDDEKVARLRARMEAAGVDDAGDIGDPLWWHSTSVFGGCEGGAHEAAMVENAYGLLCWLMDRPEACIGLATHSLLLLALYHGCLDLPDDSPPEASGGGTGCVRARPHGRHDGPQFFATAELRECVIAEAAAPPPAAGEALGSKWRELLTSNQANKHVYF